MMYEQSVWDEIDEWMPKDITDEMRKMLKEQIEEEIKKLKEEDKNGHKKEKCEFCEKISHLEGAKKGFGVEA